MDHQRLDQFACKPVVERCPAATVGALEEAVSESPGVKDSGRGRIDLQGENGGAGQILIQANPAGLSILDLENGAAKGARVQG